MKRAKQDIDNISLVWWLRSAVRFPDSDIGYSGSYGSVGYGHCINNMGVVPVCII